MKLLLDTHTLLWSVTADPALNPQAKEEISSADNVVFISLVSLWELRIKESIEKIKLPANFYRSLEPAGFELLPITLRHIEVLGKLPLHHRDPFDRMLIAQAQSDQLLLVTRDEQFKKYRVNLLFI